MFKRKPDETYRQYEARITCYIQMGILGCLMVAAAALYSLARPTPDASNQLVHNLNGACKYQAREVLKGRAKPVAMGVQP